VAIPIDDPIDALAFLSSRIDFIPADSARSCRNHLPPSWLSRHKEPIVISQRGIESIY
jgi:hypothetical protein